MYSLFQQENQRFSGRDFDDTYTWCYMKRPVSVNSHRIGKPWTYLRGVFYANGTVPTEGLGDRSKVLTHQILRSNRAWLQHIFC